MNTPIINPSTLTEEQREAIWQEYEVAKRFPTGENKHVMKTSIAVRYILVWLFGKDFFESTETKKGENNE